MSILPRKDPVYKSPPIDHSKRTSEFEPLTTEDKTDILITPVLFDQYEKYTNYQLGVIMGEFVLKNSITGHDVVPRLIKTIIELHKRPNALVGFQGNSGYPDLDRDLVILMGEAFELFCKKQSDYGPGNINAFGEYGILVRTNDKIERLKRLLNPNRKDAPVNESIEDTWMDTSIYSLIALLFRRGQWPK